MQHTLYATHTICNTHYMQHTLYATHTICNTHYMQHTLYVSHTICITHYMYHADQKSLASAGIPPGTRTCGGRGSHPSLLRLPAAVNSSLCRSIKVFEISFDCAHCVRERALKKTSERASERARERVTERERVIEKEYAYVRACMCK